jgi:predicted kinase
MLVVVCGLPGVGKSTVAEFVAEEIDAERLRTDVVRKELVDDPEYTERERRAVYEELYDRAATRIADEGAVVLDGTFWDEALRERAADLAADYDTEFVLVEVTCSADVVEQRIENRESDPSDADVSVHTQFREDFDPIERDHVTVDNSGELEQTRRQIEHAF